MEILKIESTEDNPRIVLDRESNILEISGRSLPEDVKTFYEPMMSWIELSPVIKTLVLVSATCWMS